MAITNFIPELWSASMLEAWTDQAVIAALLSREFEGQLRRGNTIHISGVVAPVVKDYKAAGRTTTADAITDTGVDLVIDQEKVFDFYVDDIDEVQAAGSLEAYTTAAAEGLTEDSENFLANMLIAGGQLLVSDITAPADGDDAFDLLADARKQLNKNKAPSAGRVVIMNAEFERLLLGASSKLTAVDTSGDSAGLRQGTLGSLLGFRCVITNYMTAVDDPQFVAFVPRSAAYVSQITETEGMRAENKFADRVRGLHVYGGKVIRPEGVIVYGADGS